MSRIVGTSALVASRTVMPMARYRVAVPRRSRLRKTLISSYGSPRSRIGITSAAPARVSLLSLVVGCRAVPLPAAPEWVPVYRRRRSAYLCPLLRLVTPNWNEYLPVQCRVVGILFFFQAEDGIRDGRVTGVQTCALPISRLRVTSQRMVASDPATDKFGP